MAPFHNPLRNLWGRAQAPPPAASGSVAHLDGVSDGAPQDYQASRPDLQQQSEVVYGNENSMPPPAAAQSYLTEADGCSQDCSQALPKDALQQYGADGCNTLNRQQNAVVVPGHERASHTIATQPPGLLSQQDQALSQTEANLELKEEPVADECDDHELFAQFTNEGVYSSEEQAAVDAHQASEESLNHDRQLAPDVIAIKTEPDHEYHTSSPALQRADTVGAAATLAHGIPTAPVHDQHGPATPTYSGFEPAVTSLASSAHNWSAQPPAQGLQCVESPPVTPAKGYPSTAMDHTSAPALPFEQHAQDPHWEDSCSQPVSNIVTSQHYPTVGQIPSSVGTALSPNGMNRAPDSRMTAHQWQQKPELFNNYINPQECPASTPSLQNCRPEPQLIAGQQNFGTAPPNGRSGSHIQRIRSGQRESFQLHISNASQAQMVVACYPQQNMQPMSTGQTCDSTTPRRRPQGPLIASVQHPADLPDRHNVDMQEEQVEVSDDEPLATRAPRHHPAPTSPTLPTTSGRSTPSKPSHPTSANDTETNPDPAADSDNESAIEPISWKLPPYEATYHPPTKPTDGPTAKVSIPNLVRADVALTEDHAPQEMELFLSVFLPGQQALSSPDPEPALAVINFHTVAVMVLEAFVQWEIGDEMGRGYGFHGGNTAMRPQHVSDDEEPVRVREAKDADVDEIFFALVDRWRAGMEANKATFKLIRGCQEFCDLALELIHYVKEHGILQPEPKKRKVRSDKGMPKGAKKNNNKTTAANGSGGGGKRKADEDDGKAGAKKPKNNTLQARKVTKAKPKAKAASITVIRKK